MNLDDLGCARLGYYIHMPFSSESWLSNLHYTCMCMYMLGTDFFSRKILYNTKVHWACTVVCTMYTCTMWDYVVWMRGMYGVMGHFVDKNMHTAQTCWWCHRNASKLSISEVLLPIKFCIPVEGPSHTRVCVRVWCGDSEEFILCVSILWVLRVSL